MIMKNSLRFNQYYKKKNSDYKEYSESNNWKRTQTDMITTVEDAHTHTHIHTQIKNKKLKVVFVKPR